MDKLLAFHTKSKTFCLQRLGMNMLVVLTVSFGRYTEQPAQRQKRVTAGELDRLRIIRVTFALF